MEYKIRILLETLLLPLVLLRALGLPIGDSIEHSSPRPLSHANTKGLVIIIEWKARITFKCIIELIYQKKKNVSLS